MHTRAPASAVFQFDQVPETPRLSSEYKGGARTGRNPSHSSPSLLQSFAMLPKLGWAFSLVATTLITLTQAAPLNTGFAPFHYGNETFQTYYKTFGLYGSSKAPLIVLHGGPGLSHDYMQVLSDLSDYSPIILYDQIGNARSTHLKDKPASFWTIELFAEQLESLISYFQLKDYVVLGHSWGGILASEFAITQPKGLKKLVLSNSPPSSELWNKAQAELTSTLPPSAQQALANGYGDPNFRAAFLGYFHLHGCDLDPWPRGLNVSVEYTFSDPTADVNMWYVVLGVVTFSQTLKLQLECNRGGPLAAWTVIDRLSKIEVPTLVINGGVNEITQDWVIQPLLDGITGVQHHKFGDSTHTPFLEQRSAYMQVVRKFLKS